MNTLRLLLVDDSERDAELLVRQVESAGYNTVSRRVDTAEELGEALAERAWDAVLADFRMPNLDGFGALEVFQRNGRDIPFVIVSGTVGEETAVALMKAGAHDYIMKDNLARLVPVIEREIAEAEQRHMRRQVESRLQERERMLADAQRIAHLGSWERDLVNGDIHWSDEAYRVFGHEPSSFAPDLITYLDGIHPEDREQVEQVIENALASGEQHEIEHRIVCPDGNMRWLFHQIGVESGAQERPVRLVGTLLDVTERKHAQAELERLFHEAEAARVQFHGLLEAAPEAVVIVDQAGRIAIVNREAERLFGYQEHEMLGQSLDFLLPERFRQGHERLLSHFMTDPQTRPMGTDLELYALRRDGTEFPVEIGLSTVVTGGTMLVTASILDITERKRAEMELRLSEQNYRTLLEQAADGIVVANPEGRVITVNTRACEMLGYAASEFLGRRFIEFLDHAELENRPLRDAQLRSGATLTNERSLRRKDGRFVPTETSSKLLDDGRVQIIIRDITERNQAEAELRRSEQEYRNLFESANDAVVIFQAEREIVLDVNPRACELYGIRYQDFIGRNLRTLTSGQAPDEIGDQFELLSGELQGYEAVRFRTDGTQLHLMISASVVGFRGQRCILSIQRDISTQKELERQLRHQALHDALTGLANRALFHDRLEHALARARGDKDDVAILVLDLDRFKLINESLGHDVGDRLLIAIGERVLLAARETDTVARMGGDEFSLLLEGVASLREVTLVAERISYLLEMPVTLDGHDIIVTTSIGIVFSPEGRGRAEDLLRNADVAMYRAKEEGRGRYVVFDPSMNATMLERLKLEADLRRAIARGELRVYYQPTVSLDTGLVTGMEALVRWMHPTRGLMSPAAFIPLAEEAGLIRLVGQWVLTSACRQLQYWHARYPGPTPIVLNVNLSAQEFQHVDVVTDVAEALSVSGVTPRDLQLEITESVVMSDAPATHARMKQLKELGVQLAIDDFGTGYSSLSYLKRFPVDTLKVDKTFIDGLGSDPEDTAIVEAIISLAHALGLSVTAEGVETEAAVELLHDLHCELGQGYFFSAPLPAEALDALWANGLRINSNWRSRIAS